MTDPFLNALAVRPQQLGPRNDRLTVRHQSSPTECYFQVTADAWAIPSSVGAGNVRDFRIEQMGVGSFVVDDIILLP